jgi:hypothetical protein
VTTQTRLRIVDERIAQTDGELCGESCVYFESHFFRPDEGRCRIPQWSRYTIESRKRLPQCLAAEVSENG